MEISTRPQKVLFVITKSNWGGAQKYVYDLATELHKKNYSISVAFGGSGELSERLTQAGIHTHELGNLKNDMNPLTSIMACFELFSYFKKERPDVVHINSSKVGLFGTIAARMAHVPHIIFTAHGWPFNENRPGWQRITLKILMKTAVFFSHRTICVSQKTLNDLSRGSLAKKCAVIHNGIAPISFKSSTAFYEETRCVRKEKITLASIGELHPSKGFDLALSYLRNLKNESWEWFILGEGHARHELEELIRNYDLSSRVHLVGHVKDAARYLQSFDVFFLPSRTEALAYVAIEALQTDLPIVASDVGGIPEVLGKDKGTTLINMHNPSTQTTLEKLLSSPLRKIPEKDRGDLRREFSLTNMVEKTIRVYQSER